MITQEQLHRAIHYDPLTGEFTWKVQNGPCSKGKRAGRHNDSGYWRITIDGVTYRAHRLAWLYMTGEWPIDQIDHINGVKDDNRWINLRQANNSQNHANKARQKNNTSGFKGVSLDKRHQRWHAYIKKDNRRHFLGYFESREEAHRAYILAAEEFFGEFARTA